jgi:hypothetical protein
MQNDINLQGKFQENSFYFFNWNIFSKTTALFSLIKAGRFLLL